MFNFTTDPEPTLTFNDKSYTGITILEILNMILLDSNNYSDDIIRNAKTYYNRVSMYFQHPLIPTLGFKLCDSRAVLPSKRIIDIGFDLTIIDVYKKISDKIVLYETGVAIKIPIGYYVELVPRSSMSKTGYMMPNSVGIIDPSYTDTVKVPLIKLDNTLPELELPVKIAQLILKPYCFSHSNQIDFIPNTTRGNGGFGSTNNCDLSCNLICNEINQLCTHK